MTKADRETPRRACCEIQADRVETLFAAAPAYQPAAASM
jgi:hypothetical protein